MERYALELDADRLINAMRATTTTRMKTIFMKIKEVVFCRP